MAGFQHTFDSFLPKSDWKPPLVSQLPSLRGVKRIAYDLETRDDQLRTHGPGCRRGGYIVGVGVAIEDGPQFYLPVRHEGGGNMPEEEVARWLEGELREYDGEIAGSGLNYDLDYSWTKGIAGRKIMMPKVKRFRDVGVAAPLKDELQMRYGLDAVCERLGIPGKDERLLREAADAYGVDPKKNLWRFHSRFVGTYVLGDLRAPLTALRRLETQLEEENLWDIYNLESDLLPVLVRMRMRGVRVDQDRLEHIERWALRVEHEELEKVRHLTGVNIGVGNVNKKVLLKEALEAIGMKVPMIPGKPNKKGGTSKPQPKITAAMLKNAKHPVTDAILRAKEFNKLRTTFCARTRKFMVDGRVHCTFTQLRTSKDDDDGPDEDDDDEDETEGARFGRTACKMPNLQQEPARNEEFGKEWRSIYLPEEWALEKGGWGALDYSQQEPRGMVHYGVLLNLPGAKEFAHAYNTDPKTDFHDMTSGICGIKRKEAKIIGLAAAYGMGDATLCQRLGLPLTKKMTPRGERLVAGPEGKALMEKFHAAVPFIKQLSYRCQDRVREVGVIRTILGRHCHFPKDDEGNPDWLHKALNRLIQGGGADQMKKALVELDRAGKFLHVVVHDEAGLSLRDLRDARECRDIMENVVQMKVRSKVDVEMGPSWGGAVGVEEEMLMAA